MLLKVLTKHKRGFININSLPLRKPHKEEGYFVDDVDFLRSLSEELASLLQQ